MNLKVHLVFPGNCEEAFNTYKRLFGGEIIFIFRKGDEKGAEVNEADKNKISHMVLDAGNFTLQGEDANNGIPVTTGDNNKLVLIFEDLDKLQKVFDGLSQGGTVTQPLEKTFFTEAIGELMDPFGIRWIIMMSDDDYEG